MEKKLVESSLRLMVFESALELGKQVDEHLLRKYKLSKKGYTFLLPIKENHFSDGHLKVEIGQTVRGMDIFALTDIGNHSITYKMHGAINHTSPNDIYCELKDGIGACNSHARRINVIMPLLYEGRQHRRITRENLSAGRSLSELQNEYKVQTFITFDAHDQGVEHSALNMEFDNFPTNKITLLKMIEDLDVEKLKDMVFIAPDGGATGRSNDALNSFASPCVKRDSGFFVKRRDYNHFVDGKYPVVAHEYSGPDLEGKTAIIVDDMISSGGSMIDTIQELKRRGARYIYVVVSYVLFTEGIDKFEECYRKGKLDGLYTTNLSYIPEEYQKKKWIHVCDCSKYLADIIYNIHEDQTISPLLKDKSETLKLLTKKFQSQ